MEFDMVNKMKVQELKYFLRVRGLKVSERKCEFSGKSVCSE